MARRIGGVVLIAVAASVGVSVQARPGQAGSQQQAPVFRAGVSLVTIDVTVLDRDGQPVPDLTAADFTVQLDKHPAAVRSLDFERGPATSSSAAVKPSAAGVREASNAAPASEPRVFVLLADDLSLSPARGKSMLFAAARFVEGLPATDLVGFTTTSRTATINPTLNHAAVEAALRHTVGEFIDPRQAPPNVTVGLGEALEIAYGSEATLEQVAERECQLSAQASAALMATNSCVEQLRQKAQHISELTDATATRQRQAYRDVIAALRPAPGIKHVVIISDGLAVETRESGKLADLARAAAAAGVELSVLYEEADMNMQDAQNAAMVRRDDDRSLLMTGVQTLADLTGGEFYHVIGAPDPFFARVGASASGVYRLGVEAPAGVQPGRDFALSVAVNRPNVTVDANRHAVAPEAMTEGKVDARLRDAVTKGALLYGVPLSVNTTLRRGRSANEIELGANVEVPADVPGPLTLRFGLLDRKGGMKTAEKTIPAAAAGSNYRVSMTMPVAPGDYRLRFAVADATGEMGSLDMGVAAALPRIGPYLSSDLLTEWTAANGAPQFLALDSVPPTATGLHAFLELYPASGSEPPANVRVRFTLAPADEAPGQPGETHEVAPLMRGDVAYASADFRVSDLPPGEYALTAVVLSGGATLGQASTTVIRRP